MIAKVISADADKQFFAHINGKTDLRKLNRLCEVDEQAEADREAEAESGRLERKLRKQAGRGIAAMISIVVLLYWQSVGLVSPEITVPGSCIGFVCLGWHLAKVTQLVRGEICDER